MKTVIFYTVLYLIANRVNLLHVEHLFWSLHWRLMISLTSLVKVFHTPQAFIGPLKPVAQSYLLFTQLFPRGHLKWIRIFYLGLPKKDFLSQLYWAFITLDFTFIVISCCTCNLIITLIYKDIDLLDYYRLFFSSFTWVSNKNSWELSKMFLQILYILQLN